MPKSNTPRVLVDSQGREFPASIIDKELVRRDTYTVLRYGSKKIDRLSQNGCIPTVSAY